MSSGVEAVVAEFGEEGVVPRFVVFAVGLELGDRHRLGEFGHLRHVLAVGSDRVGASFELEGIRLGDADPFVVFGRRREEALRAQRRQQAAHAAGGGSPPSAH